MNTDAKKAEKRDPEHRDADGRFQSGHRLGGRPKGSTGMNATAFRDSLLRAYQRLGGEEWVIRIAEENPVAVLKMLAHVLPRRIEAEMVAQGPRYDPSDVAGLSDAELIERANAGAMLQALVPMEEE